MASSVEAANASTTRAQFSSTRDPDDEKNRRQLIGLPGAAGVGSRARPLEPPQQIHSQQVRDPQLPASCRGLGLRTCNIPVQGFWKVSLQISQHEDDPRLQISAAGIAQKTGLISDSLTRNGHHRRHTAPGPARGRAQQGTGSPAAAAGRHWGHLGQAATPGQGEALCFGVLHNRVAPLL